MSRAERWNALHPDPAIIIGARRGGIKQNLVCHPPLRAAAATRAADGGPSVPRLERERAGAVRRRVQVPVDVFVRPDSFPP